MKYVFGFLAAVGLIVLVFILIIRGFSARTPKEQIDLISYTKTDTIVQLSVDGPVNSDKNHRGYRIAVGRDKATIETTKGYQAKTIKIKHYPSNEKAYGAFLRSLQLLGFTRGNSDPTRADERGYCPDGLRYVFEIVKDGKDVRRYWSTSCGGGTFRGGTAKISILFHKQIPDYTAIVKDLQLGSF